MSADDEMPDRLGPYRLLDRIGEGGMGVVYLARDPSQRAVAVKVLRPGLAAEPNALRRLAREVETMQRVRSPFVAEVIDADLAGDLPYIVTRYVPGRTLDQVVAGQGPLRGAALAGLARGLADALAAVHAAGVVHRDLKPSNVMMLSRAPVVIDFGIAQGPDATRLTMTGMFMGTPGYLSPEVIEGQPSSEASDVHAWGATVAFAATGRPPFGTGSYETIFYKIVNGQPDLDGAPATLLPLLAAALARDPAHRPSAVQLGAHVAMLDPGMLVPGLAAAAGQQLAGAPGQATRADAGPALPAPPAALAGMAVAGGAPNGAVPCLPAGAGGNGLAGAGAPADGLAGVGPVNGLAGVGPVNGLAGAGPVNGGLPGAGPPIVMPAGGFAGGPAAPGMPPGGADSSGVPGSAVPGGAVPGGGAAAGAVAGGAAAARLAAEALAGGRYPAAPGAVGGGAGLPVPGSPGAQPLRPGDFADVLPPVVYRPPPGPGPAAGPPPPPILAAGRPAASAPARGHALLATASMVLMAAISVVFPVAGTAVALGLIVLLRTAGAARRGAALRRSARGAQRTDLVIALLTFPWLLIRSVIGLIVFSPIAVAIAALVSGIAMIRPAQFDRLPHAIAYGMGALVAFYGLGPGSAGGRNQLSHLYAVIAPTRIIQAAALVTVAALALAAATAALSAPSLAWWPPHSQVGLHLGLSHPGLGQLGPARLSPSGLLHRGRALLGLLHGR